MTKFCMTVDIHDLITCATLCDDRLRGLGVARGRISSFPVELRACDQMPDSCRDIMFV